MTETYKIDHYLHIITVCVYACVRACQCVHVCVYVCMCICTCLCMKYACIIAMYVSLKKMLDLSLVVIVLYIAFPNTSW